MTDVSVMGGKGEPGLGVRLPVDPASVPAARRFVVAGLTAWGMDDLVDDAALCVTELAANATLHGGGGHFDVRVEEERGAVRIAVTDGGSVPVEAVAPRRPRRRSGPVTDDAVDVEPTTGRGLAIVSTLATSWGVDETAAGTRVWLLLVPGTDEPVPPGPPVRLRPVEHRAQAAPAGWCTVRLLACPVALSLLQDQHLDELVRELQLLDAGGSRHSAELAALMEGLLTRNAQARHEGRQRALAADAAGLVTVDIQMVLPREAARDVVELNRLAHRADALCEAAQLLTLASPPDVRALRDWMTEEVARQVEGVEPVPFGAWRAGRGS